MIENVDVGGFEISAEDMSKMDDLDEYLVTDWCVPHSLCDEFDWIQMSFANKENPGTRLIQIRAFHSSFIVLCFRMSQIKSPPVLRLSLYVSYVHAYEMNSWILQEYKT